MGKSRTRTPPRRLVETQDLGAAVRGAAGTDFDAERMAANRVALLSKLDDLTLDIPPMIRLPLIPRRALPVLLAGLLFVSVGASAYYYYRAVVVPARDREEEADAAGVDPSPHSRHRGSRRPRPEEPATVAEPEPSGAETREADGSPKESAQGERRSVKHRPDRSFQGLDRQVRLFNEAKARVAAGDHAGGIRRLDELGDRFPGSPLGVESMELRARALSRLGRYREADSTVRALLGTGVPARKKAQLYRFLGDLQVRQGACDRAVESYRHALGLGLPKAESEAARAGIRRCAK